MNPCPLPRFGIGRTVIVALLAVIPLGCQNDDSEVAVAGTDVVTVATIAPEHITSSIAVDDGFVYFGDGLGRVLRAPKGGGESVVLTSVAGTIGGIAVDAGCIYFGTNLTGSTATLWMTPKVGGAATQLAGSIAFITDVRIDANTVYFVDMGSRKNGVLQADGRVLSIPKTGGTPTVLVANLATPIGIAMDDADLFFGEIGGLPGAAFGPSGLRRIPKTGGSVTSLVDGIPGYALALDDAFVYATAAFDGRVYRVTKSGGGIDRVYATGLIFPTDIRVQKGSVVFTVDDNAGPNGTILSVPVTGGAVVTLHGGMNTACYMTADEERAYVIAKKAGTIVSVPWPLP